MSEEDVQDTGNSATLSLEELDLKLLKIAKKISDEQLVEDLRNMSKDDLKARITKCQVNIAESQLAQERDEELANAKELVKQYRGPYADAIKLQKLISEYATLRLNYE